MKNVLFGMILMALGTSAAHAADVKASVGASTDYFYHGVSLTNGEPTVFGSLKVDNVFVDNLSLSVDGAVLNSAPLNANKTVRADFGVAYKFAPADAWTVDVGAYRVVNPVIYSADYNELRAKATWKASDRLSVFGGVTNILSDAVPNDTYLSVGLNYDQFLVAPLSVGLQANSLYSDAANQHTFNNLELTANYKVTPKVDVFALYSVGGSTTASAFDVPVSFRGNPIPSGGLVGVKYTF